MATPAPQLSLRAPLWGRLESFARIGALLAGSVYVAGFIVVTVHHGQFGIGETDLFKARALSAGILFALMIALPVATCARVFGLYGLSSSTHLPVPFEAANAIWIDRILALAMYWPCFALSFAMQAVFQSDAAPPHPLWKTLIFWGSLAGTFTAYFLGNKYPRRCLVGAAIAVSIGIWGIYVTQSETVFLMGLWFYGCALLTKWAHRFFRDPSTLRSFEWERYVMVPLALVFFFSIFLYGRMSFQIGGGAAVSIRAHLIDDKSKLFPTDPAPAWLIEETDNGFYVLKSATDKSAMFIPRASVRAIEFNVATKDSAGSTANAPAADTVIH